MMIKTSLPTQGLRAAVFFLCVIETSNHDWVHTPLSNCPAQIHFQSVHDRERPLADDGVIGPAVLAKYCPAGLLVLEPGAT